MTTKTSFDGYIECYKECRVRDGLLTSMLKIREPYVDLSRPDPMTAVPLSDYGIKYQPNSLISPVLGGSGIFLFTKEVGEEIIESDYQNGVDLLPYSRLIRCVVHPDWLLETPEFIVGPGDLTAENVANYWRDPESIQYNQRFYLGVYLQTVLVVSKVQTLEVVEI